jgi:uncharacterized membrane protein YkoI
MTLTKAKMAAVLCGLSMAGAGMFSGGMHMFDTSPAAAANMLGQATPASGTVTTQPTITIEKALEIARGQATGDVRELELDKDNGVLTWKVKLGNAKVSINADNGTVLKVTTKDTTETFPAAKITIEKAIEIAKGNVQGDFREAELELDNGALVWEVEIGNSEVLINAEDGTVISVQDDNENHDDEHKSDSGRHDDDD